MTARRRKRAKSYITGEKGKNRVRLFSHARDGSLYAEFRENGARTAVALGHSDFDRGKAQADEIALKLRQNETPKSGALTLKALFDKYESDTSRPVKSVGKQQHDKRARKLFEECWGANALVLEL